MVHQYLQWDSDFFKFKVAEIKLPANFEFKSLDDLVNKLKEEDCRLIYLYVDPADTETNKLAVAKNWLLADEKITYSLDLSADLNKDESADISIYFENYPNNELISLAIQSGEWSRFKIDKNFKPDDYKKLYRAWIEKSVKSEMADVVLVHRTEEYMGGMITISIQDNVGIIGLIGVDELARGRGVGTKLIDAAINYCLAKGASQIKVTTQKQNNKACRFYEKNNFKIDQLVNLYHIWL